MILLALIDVGIVALIVVGIVTLIVVGIVITIPAGAIRTSTIVVSIRIRAVVRFWASVRIDRVWASVRINRVFWAGVRVLFIIIRTTIGIVTIGIVTIRFCARCNVWEFSGLLASFVCNFDLCCASPGGHGPIFGLIITEPAELTSDCQRLLF